MLLYVVNSFECFRNGVSRIGVFCTIHHCWDRMRTESEIDIFSAAKVVMMNRPQLIDTDVHTLLLILLRCVTSYTALVSVRLSDRLHVLPHLHDAPHQRIAQNKCIKTTAAVCFVTDRPQTQQPITTTTNCDVIKRSRNAFEK